MIGRGFITAYGENVVILTKSRMYKSKSRAVKKAAAAIAACVRWSKTRRYETPYGHPAHRLIGKPKCGCKRIGISERGKFLTWSYCGLRSAEEENRVAAYRRCGITSLSQE